VYITIYQKNFASAINSSAVELQTSDTQKMIEYVFSLFNRFINSNDTIRLDESFSVYFKVLSMDHVNVSKHRRKPNVVVGALNEARIRNQGTISISSGYPKNPIAFVNKCLLTSVIMGHLQNQSTNNDAASEEFEDLLYLCSEPPLLPGWIKIKSKRKKFRSPKNYQKNKAGKFLENYLKTVIRECNIEPCGPYDIHTVLPQLSNYFASQINVIQSLQGETASIFSYPDEFDCSLPQIFLDASLPNHVSMITNTIAFCRQFNKTVCMFCKKTSSLYHVHDCTKRTVCKKCHRFMKKVTTLEHNIHFLKFCDSEIRTDYTKEEEPRCQICGQLFKTENCFTTHYSKCGKIKPNHPLPKGRNGYYCIKCEKCYNFGFANSEDAKKNHVCDKSLVKCTNCHQYEEENHMCKIKKQDHTTKWPNLAFFSFTYKNSEECRDCYEKRRDFRVKHNLTLVELYRHKDFSKLYCSEVCENKTNHAEPNVAVVYKEIKRGTFKKFVLFEDELDFDLKITEDTENFNYNSDYSGQNLVMHEKYISNVSGLKISLETILTKEKKTLLDKFVLLITQPSWQNYTFLSFNGDRCENLSILRAFAELNLLPNVIQNGNRISSMFFKCLEIRFLNASAFISGSLENWINQHGLNKTQHFFPMELNEKSNYDLNGEIPKLQHFLNFSNTPDEHKLITKFYYTLRAQNNLWNFKQELLKSSVNKAEIIFLSCMTFLKSSLEFQNQLKASQKIKSKAYLHPFGKGIYSLSGYTYQLFSLYFQNNYEIYTVRNEYSSGPKASSKKELLFVWYKEFSKNLECNFVHAFNSPMGQKRFLNYYADLYCSTHKKVFSFRGCSFHYCEKCMARKGQTDQSLHFSKVPMSELKKKDQEEETFYLTKCGPEVLSFEAVYECDFNEETKKDLFITYKEFDKSWDPPTIRLTPRATVRSGLTEQYHLKWKQKEFPDENFFISGIYFKNISLQGSML